MCRSLKRGRAPGAICKLPAGASHLSNPTKWSHGLSLSAHLSYWCPGSITWRSRSYSWSTSGVEMLFNYITKLSDSKAEFTGIPELDGIKPLR